eukprot:11349877-Alexandrium_andersonii.AAC.1
MVRAAINPIVLRAKREVRQGRLGFPRTQAYVGGAVRANRAQAFRHVLFEVERGRQPDRFSWAELARASAI